ncbi:MAG: SRPBCC family protein [Candidatus Nanopelagicales bacterium]
MSGSVRIARPVEEVFQAVIDEPSWNPAMRSATMLTPPPPGAGSRYEVVMDLGRGGMPMQVEFTAFDPPNRLASRTLSTMMATTGEVTCTAEGDGTLLAWDWQYRLLGAIRVGGPVFALFAGRWERRNWLRLRDLLEERSPG